MNVFVAGATGVLGRAAVSALVAAGHRVSGVARTAEKAALLRDMGAEPVSADLFDPKALTSAVAGHEAVCNFATKIPASAMAYWRRSAWSTNDRLHREASRYLVDAALATGATGYLQHSAGFQYADGGDRWLDEDAPLAPPPHGDSILEAEGQARRFTESGGVGIALRFGFFYGPLAPNTRDLVRIARMGFVPFPGTSEAYLPWIHTNDLGTAVVAALGAPAGVYNVVDDEPITRGTWADILAQALGRKRLRLAPRTLMRLIPQRYDYIRRSQRVSNRRFKGATAWSPSVASPREGWARTMSAFVGA